ncbi:hypothetical protein FGRMN_3681 [Fusarium graminum]|nr:hypothetical protein FGRMN_3681 [Fusarium graminum]
MMYQFRIPRFRVDDDSSVTVVETKTGFEKSMANSSFSEASFQIAAGASMAGASATAQIGAAIGAKDSTAYVEAKEESSLVVNYNFPRVSLYWDHKSLAVSEECLEDIKTVVDPRTRNEFNEKYGHVFSTRIQLGGRLSTSQKVVTSANSRVEDQARKLKASASASISASFAEASVSASYEKQSKQSDNSAHKDFSSSMAWEATGGDTLLCNNPAQWCSTVNLYDNWRIVNQDEVVPLYRFLAKFPEVGESIIDRFEKVFELQYKFGDDCFFTLTVDNGKTEIFDHIKKDTGHWAEDDNSAKATVHLAGADFVSENESRFVVRYGGIFRANSLEHPQHWSLASHVTPPKSSRKSDLVYAHLVGQDGSICLYNVDRPESRDHIRDGDKVYLCLNNTKGTNPQGPQLVDDTSADLNLKATEIWQAGQKEPPAKAKIGEDGRMHFLFKLHEPYEGVRAPGPTS